MSVQQTSLATVVEVALLQVGSGIRLGFVSLEDEDGLLALMVRCSGLGGKGGRGSRSVEYLDSMSILGLGTRSRC